jgi:hemolysin D
MSVTEIAGRGGSVGPAVPASAPAPRALIDYDFQSILAAPPKQRWILWLMAALIVVAAIGLFVAKVDMIVSANGKLATRDSPMVIQPIETSVVRSIAVRVGDKVKAGAILATLDPTFTEADAAELDAKLRHSQAAFDRLTTEIAGQVYDPANPNDEQREQRDIYRRRQQEYDSKVTSSETKARQYRADLEAHKIEAKGLTEQIALIGQQEQMYKTLVAQNLVSKLKLLDMSQRLVEAKDRLGTNTGEQLKLQEQIAGAVAERESFIHEWRRKLSDELAQTSGERDAAAARLSKAKMRHDLSIMRAPADGTVLEIADRPAGAVIREAETLMRLVPADVPLVADLQIDTRDVARLHPGDQVTVKFEALPWQQFGLARGTLRTLTPDVLNDENSRQTAEDMSAPDMKTQARQSPIHYRARIEIDKTEFRNLPDEFQLRPGMRLVGDIKVGRRSVLEYILNPITRVLDESLREP